MIFFIQVLRSAPQAQALSHVLAKDKNHPSLGTYIKRLRIEGCYGAYLARIFKSSPNITHLFLSINIPAATAVKTLLKGLRQIRPTHLIFDDSGEVGRGNKCIHELLSGVTACIEDKMWPLVRSNFLAISHFLIQGA